MAPHWVKTPRDDGSGHPTVAATPGGTLGRSPCASPRKRSTPTTSCPLSTSAAEVAVPMNPAAPVNSTLMTGVSRPHRDLASANPSARRDVSKR